MLTSLFFCFESDVWTCKTSAKLGSIASVSIVAFFAANVLTRKLKFDGTKLHVVNSLIVVLPQILMSLAETEKCKGKKKHSVGDGVKIVTVYGVPLVGYLLSTSTTAHTMACSFMATTGLDPAAVAKARAKLEAAKKVASTRYDAMRSKGGAADGNNRNLPYWAKFQAPSPAGREQKPFTHHKTTLIPSKFYSRNRQELNRLTRNF
ncbi:hypothetical protein JKP88DRAFT_251712 [Tribonema minus]|uniref:Uncharacterized protein n=1 Tax=Tribonema minus TaxID=303371 RepID=A0A836CPY8_9STRA|nr:hypothetical protein JKP88DRAFT_251712 [Tribonema minus]